MVVLSSSFPLLYKPIVQIYSFKFVKESKVTNLLVLFLVLANKIYYRLGTYGNDDSPGISWEMQPGSLKNIDVGRDMCVGTNINDDIYIREGMNDF